MTLHANWSHGLRPLGPIAALVVLSVASSTVASAQSGKSNRHTVKKGDTLALLAAEYYGSRKHSIYIMKENGMTHPRPLKPREVLKIPVSRTITARPGDSFDGLAEEHLADERRGEFLASFNKLSPDDGLAAGQRLRIPFSIVHVAQRDVAISEISLSYFGDRSQTNVIRSYNFLSGPKVPKGTRVVIPVVNVRSVEAAPDKESEALSKKRREEQAEAKTSLEAAVPKWRSGSYREVIALLSGIDTDFLDAGQAVAVGVLLGGAYVATGDEVTAKTQFLQVLERRKSYRLSPVTYSPKILAIWKDAGGELKAAE